MALAAVIAIMIAGTTWTTKMIERSRRYRQRSTFFASQDAFFRAEMKAISNSLKNEREEYDLLISDAQSTD